jgi:hypothetical protein
MKPGYFASQKPPCHPSTPANSSTTSRAQKAWECSNSLGDAASILNTFTAPIALKNIRYEFTYCSRWNWPEAGITRLLFLETKGRTLEELQEAFDAKNPGKASMAKTKIRRARVQDEE